MIFVGSTGGRWVASRAGIRRPSDATRSSPSRSTVVGAPSTTILRVSTGRRIGRVPELGGFMVPRSPEGRASIVPEPPWHYSGDVLTLEYRAASGSVARWLPAGVDPAVEDPDAVAVIFADWQSCSDGGEELLDPVRAQYKEAVVVVRCRRWGETDSRCILIWVDKDVALARGWFQGYPKKLGSIWMTRPVEVGKAGPKLGPGATFGATLAANDRRLIDARFTIERPSETGGFVNALPMLHS